MTQIFHGSSVGMVTALSPQRINDIINTVGQLCIVPFQAFTQMFFKYSHITSFLLLLSHCVVINSA